MNWDALSAVAELIAALAVLATLVYLAAQIRQNTKALSGASMDSITNHGFQELKWGAELHPIFLKAREDDASLSELERRQVTSWITASLRNRQNEYFLWKHGALNEEVLAASESILRAILTMPLALEWFQTTGKSVWAPDFYEYAVAIYEEQPGEWSGGA